MILFTFVWSLCGLFAGYTGGTHDVRVMGWVLLAMSAVMWIAETSYAAYVKNANASANLAARTARRRDGGAL